MPLSFGEEKLWCFEKTLPSDVSHHPPFSVRLDGPVRLHALRASLTALLARHESLRTRFPLVGGRPHRAVDPPGPCALRTVDLSGVDPEQQDILLGALVHEITARPYHLEDGPLSRMLLARLSDTEHSLMIGVHHLVYDLWSQTVIARDLAALYRACSEGAPSRLAPIRIQYADYANWQREQLQGERLNERISHWRSVLNGVAELRLPADFPRPETPNLHKDIRWWTSEPEVADQLRALSRTVGVTVFTAVLSVFQVLLARCCDTEDVVVVSPTANRLTPELEAMTGFVVCDAWLRGDLSGDPTFRELMGRTYHSLLLAQDGHVPYEQLAVAVDPGRDLRPHPLLQVHFAVHNFSAPKIELPGLRLAGMEHKAPDIYLSPTDLEMQAYDHGAGPLLYKLVYDPALFAAVTVERLGARFAALLRAVVADPDARISTLPMLTGPEREQLRQWRGEARRVPDAGLLAGFAASAHRSPDRVAVRAGRRHVSYRALRRRVNRLAARLTRLGVGAEKPVVLALDPGPAQVAAVLATLTAGGVVVLAEPTWSPEQWREAADVGSVVVTETGARRLPRRWNATLIRLDDQPDPPSSEPQPPPAMPESLACLSGGPGPATVGTPRRALHNLTRTLRRAAPPSGRDRWAARPDAPVAARLAAMLAPLGSGGSVVFGDVSGEDPAVGCDVAVVGAAPLHEMRGLLADGVRVVGCVAGDQTGCCLVEPVEGPASFPRGELVHGRPVDNTRAEALDPDLRSVPIGLPGQLHVAGEGVIRGYRGQPAMTAERLLPDPRGEPGSRRHATGLTIRHRFDGRLEAAGDAGQVVELGGRRINLGHVARTLADHPGIASAVVIVSDHDTGVLTRRLLAYLSPVVAPGPGEADLRDHAAASLPLDMRPAAYIRLTALPITPDGEIDRAALPAPELAETFPRTAPATPTEHTVAALWRRALGVAEVSREDNFFLLGGYSLVASELAEQIRARFGVAFGVADCWSAPTLLAMAGRVDSLRGESITPL